MLARTGHDTHVRRNPNPKKNQVKLQMETLIKKHEDYERWHGQSPERNQGQGMSKVLPGNRISAIFARKSLSPLV